MANCSNILPDPRRANLVWVVGPVVAGIGLAAIVVMVILFKRRRHPVKQPMDGGQIMTPLMSGFEMQNASVIAPSDPVEMRRMNYLNRSAGIRGDWKKNGYSPNNLSRNIIW